MQETYEFLKKTEVNYLSTIDGNKPSCRPFGVPVIYKSKMYILTSKNKNVSKQISLNNNVCIVAYDNENWIRINCELIDDSNNLEAKKAFLNEYPGLLECGYSLENEDMQVLYMSKVESIIYDEDGNAIHKFYF